MVHTTDARSQELYRIISCIVSTKEYTKYMTKQLRWFLNLPYPEQAKLYERFAKQNPNLFQSVINHEYNENRPEADPDRELINITPE